MAFKILLPQPIMESGMKYLLNHGFEVVVGNGFTEEDIIRDIKGCDAMIVRTAKITRRIIEAADKLKVMARHGAGFDGVDLEAAKEKGIMVLYAPRANSESVAELALFYMLHCSRNFKLVQKLYKDDYMTAKMKVEKHELNGKTLGLIGVGNIGGLVAKKAHYGFDMNVVAFDPYAKEVPDYITLAASRDEVFEKADYVSLHIPATPDTVNSVGAHEFEIMKETAFLINTSRGTVVDEEALIKALEEKKIAGAALDVTQKEPINPDNPLLAMDNVLTAPHIGGATKEAASRSSLICAQGIDEFLNGIKPDFPVPPMREQLNAMDLKAK
ncbi:MAG: hydroxyacid dehydrogenase [Lachnospiraceae bacterium]|nr:hydroxyacid dehydrogenase [Lachnospiraceae bacterium]